MNTIEFIAKANKIHNNKYTYENTIYVKSKEKVIITCLTHGNFEQVAYSHLKGHGCKKCGSSLSNLSIDKHISAYQSKIDNIFKDKNYHIFSYSPTNVTITCPIHGNFFFNRTAFLKSKGCPHCSKIKDAKQRSIELKNKLLYLGTNYSYEKLESEVYSLVDPITITCIKHGDFKQSAKNHLNGANCPHCANLSRSYKERYNSKLREATVYFVYFPNLNLYKLGVTIDVTKRFNGEPIKPEILFTKTYDTEQQAYYIETELFKQFYEFKYKGTIKLKRKGHTELITSNIQQFILPSVETIENTEEFKAISGSE